MRRRTAIDVGAHGNYNSHMKSRIFPRCVTYGPFGPIGPFAVRAAALILCAALAAGLVGCERFIYPGSPYGYQGKDRTTAPAGETGGAPEKKSKTALPGDRWSEKRIVVRRGDTLFAISRTHKVPLRDLIEANRLAPPYHLREGERLVLPQIRIHTVAKGDTVYAISRRYDVNMSQLVRINGIDPPYKIKVGEVLRLPASVTRAAVSSGAKRASKSGVSLPPAKAADSPGVAKKAVRYTPPPRAGRLFHWPLRGRLAIPFGPSSGGLHNDGINILAARGAPVEAADNGVVVYAGNELRGFGNLLLIKHADGWISAYAHNETLLVRRGQRVKRGDVIARVGSTGNVSVPQLHFELRRGSRAVDPRKHLAA